MLFLSSKRISKYFFIDIIALNKIFVIQGELNLYEPNGKLKESRKAGTYTTSPADVNPHRECGGDEGAVVLFSIRGANGMLYEVLDEDQHRVDVVLLHTMKLVDEFVVIHVAAVVLIK